MAGFFCGGGVSVLLCMGLLSSDRRKRKVRRETRQADDDG